MQKNESKPKTTRVSNPIAVAIHKVTAVLEGLTLTEAGIVMRAVTDCHEARYEKEHGPKEAKEKKLFEEPAA